MLTLLLLKLFVFEPVFCMWAEPTLLMKDANIPRLIQQMMQPTFYPHPVCDKIELIQTHVSFVLLTGNYVYKVKKPVSFGFLDYSTLAKRHHFCQQELLLNKRGAPEIYLEVLPISQIAEQYQLGGNEPVEYTVKMKQFPQEALFINLFEQGKLTEANLENLGKVVANFHKQCSINDYIRSFGKASKIRFGIEKNYEQTAKYIGGPQTQEQFEATKKFTDQFLEENEVLIESRIQNNWIRECHGDLHIRNIALWENNIILFDCIEFNENLRFVDVMFDIAYAVMDFDARNRPDFGNTYLNTYIEQTGDWEGLQVLPLYLTRQAYVRAKVSSFLLDDPAISAEEKQKASEIAAKYYNLAWQYTQPKQGKLILMTGLSGSGKTTVARQLARRLNAIHIRSDAVRKHLAGIPLNERGGDEIYTAEMTQKTYSRLLEIGVMLAGVGFAVILDAKYDKQALRKEAINKAQNYQLPLQFFHCTAPEQILRERLEKRKGDIADATADLLASQIRDAEAFTDAEKSYVTTLDTTQEITTQDIIPV